MTTLTTVPLFALVALYLFLLALGGRAVVVICSAKLGRNVLLNPLAGVLTALGVWLWLMLYALAHAISLQAMAWGFLIASILACFIWVKTWRFHGRELDWVMPILTTFVLFFIWPILRQDAPTTLAEFSTLFAIPKTLIYHPSLTENTQLTALQHIGTSPAVWGSLSPAWQTIKHMVEPLATLFYAGVFVLIAPAMLQATAMRLRWSNVPILAAGSLLGITVLNPFFTTEMLTEFTPTLLAAAGLLVLFLPFTKAQLPAGMGVIPLAFIASFTALTTPAIWPVLGALYVWWILREFALTNTPSTLPWYTRISGTLFLGGLPTCAALWWQSQTQNLGANIKASLNLLPADGLWFPLHPYIPFFVVAGLVLLFVFAHYHRLVQEEIPPLWPWLRQQSPLFITLTCAFTLIFTSPIDETANRLAYLQFILLIPFWRSWLAWYETSPLKAQFFAKPWYYGGILLCCLAGISFASKNMWYPQPPLAARHAKAVAQHISQQEWINNLKTLATLSPTQGKKATGGSTALMYYSLPFANVIPADMYYAKSDGLRSFFHGILWQTKADALWIHSPTPATRAMFLRNLRSDYSYLFEITENSFQLIRRYPHAAYTGSGWTPQAPVAENRYLP